MLAVIQGFVYIGLDYKINIFSSYSLSSISTYFSHNGKYWSTLDHLRIIIALSGIFRACRYLFYESFMSTSYRCAFPSPSFARDYTK